MTINQQLRFKRSIISANNAIYMFTAFQIIYIIVSRSIIIAYIIITMTTDASN